MEWYLRHHTATPEMLGLLPEFLNEDDPRSAREQLHDNYSHGGGFRPMPGFTMTENALHYPGDPQFVLLAETQLRDEIIRVYNYSWVAIIQKDGSFVVSHMD